MVLYKMAVQQRDVCLLLKSLSSGMSGPSRGRMCFTRRILGSVGVDFPTEIKVVTIER